LDGIGDMSDIPLDPRIPLTDAQIARLKEQLQPKETHEAKHPQRDPDKSVRPA